MYKRASRAAGTGRHLVTTIMNVTVVLLAGNVKIVRWTVRLHCPPQQWVTESCRTAGTFSYAHLGWMRESNRGPFGFFFFFLHWYTDLCSPSCWVSGLYKCRSRWERNSPISADSGDTRSLTEYHSLFDQLDSADCCQARADESKRPVLLLPVGGGSRFSCFSSLTFSLWASQSSTYFRLTSLQPCIYKTGRSSKRLGK